MIPSKYPDSGGMCQMCGKKTERNYLMPVIYHPQGKYHNVQIPMMMCVECIAKAQYNVIPGGMKYGKV
jgi:hypothetical protein